MNFTLKKTKEKETAVYKSLYIKEALAQKIEDIARENNTSFNNVIISMIEYCLGQPNNLKNSKIKK
jgi:hypothetical protein